MATVTFNQVFDNSTLANFKAWGQALSGAFSTLGWVQTADSGQVNWSSIGAVPSSAFVYEVWKANDSLIGTLPIYIKMQYGYSTSYPMLAVTVGTGSNGSGTITGQVIASQPWQGWLPGSAGNKGATLYPCYVSGDTGNFRLAMWASNVDSVMQLFGVERSHDSSTGNDTAEFFTVIWTSTPSSFNCYQQTIFPTITVAREAAILCCIPTTGTASAFCTPTSTTAAFPVWTLAGKVSRPLKDWMAAVPADVGQLATVTVTAVYGATHSYIALKEPSNQLGQSFGAHTVYGTAVLMRYE